MSCGTRSDDIQCKSVRVLELHVDPLHYLAVSESFDVMSICRTS
jgi:hypothetical protein